jgi:hypothetical protein
LAFDRTLVQIRERSFLDILDLALVVIRDRPKALGIAALAGCLPFALFNAWLTSDDSLPTVLYLGLLIMEAPWATAPLTLVLGGLMFGEKPSTRRVVRDLVRSTPPMLFFHVFLRGILVSILILIPLLPGRFAFLNEVILLERGKWSTFYRRSGDLCGERGVELFFRAVAAFCFGLLFVFCFWFASLVASYLLLADWSWEDFEPAMLYSPSTQLAIWVTICFFTVVRFLTYIDQRIRLEGWEVELRLRHVGAALENAEPW